MVSVVEEISFDVCTEIGADRTFVRRVFDNCRIETLVGHTERGVEDRSAVSAFSKRVDRRRSVLLARRIRTVGTPATTR